MAVYCDATICKILENTDAVYSQFCAAHSCYDLIPTSTKVVVFDTKLCVSYHFGCYQSQVAYFINFLISLLYFYFSVTETGAVFKAMTFLIG